MSSVFHPNNRPRADRLQQLINHIGIIQGDITKEKNRMDELDKENRAKLNDLLKSGKIKSLEELEKEAKSKLTDAEKKEYEELIKATKDLADVTDTMWWAGLLLGGNKLMSWSGKAIMALVRRIAGLQLVRAAVTAFAKAIPALTKGAGAAGKAISDAAAKAGRALDAARRASGYTNSRLSRIVKSLGKVGKWLSWFGVVLVALTPLIDIIGGENQKKQLIEGIHDTQVTRLMVSELKQHARNITENMSTIKVYLSLIEKGNKPLTDALGAEIITSIQEQDNKIKLSDLENDLREADKSTTGFYDEDDWSASKVVDEAETGIEKDKNTSFYEGLEEEEEGKGGVEYEEGLEEREEGKGGAGYEEGLAEKGVGEGK